VFSTAGLFVLSASAGAIMTARVFNAPLSPFLGGSIKRVTIRVILGGALLGYCLPRQKASIKAPLPASLLQIYALPLVSAQPALGLAGPLSILQRSWVDLL